MRSFLFWTLDGASTDRYTCCDVVRSFCSGVVGTLGNTSGAPLSSLDVGVGLDRKLTVVLRPLL